MYTEYVISLVKAMLIYLQKCAVDEQSDRTIESKSYSLRHFIRWHIVEYGLNLEDICKDSIDDYKIYLKTYLSPHSGKVITEATRRNKVTHVVSFVRRMYELGYLHRDPSLGVKLPKVNRKLPTGILQEAEVNAIKNETVFYGLKGKRDAALLELLYACGIRRNEAAGLNLSSICQQDDTVMIYVKDRKCRNDRYVPIAPDSLQEIMDYVRNVRLELLIHGGEEALILGDDGKRIKDKKVSTIVTKYKRRAGVTKPGAANLYRHTTATLMLQNGADLRVVQTLLGHRSISTTQIYTHIALGHEVSVYDRTHPAAMTSPIKESIIEFFES